MHDEIVYGIGMTTAADTMTQDLPSLCQGCPSRGLASNLVGGNDRLRTLVEEYLSSLSSLALPFTNNSAETDLRICKLHVKMSGCFRTERGAVNFARVNSFLSTARKQGRDTLEAITLAVLSRPNQAIWQGD